MYNYKCGYYENSRGCQNSYVNNNEMYWPNCYSQSNWCEPRYCCEPRCCCDPRQSCRPKYAVTQCSMNAQNTTGQDITVAVSGTAIPLPNNQNLDGFTANASNTIFTVPVTGTYLVTYQVNTTTTLLLSTRVLRNGAAIPGSIYSPVAPDSSFTASTIVQLYAGDQLELQFFDLATTATLQGGVGASLTVIRLA